MTTTTFTAPPQFQPESSNPAAAWKEYRDSFQIYAKAAKLSTEDQDIQIATFLHILGAPGRRIYNTLDVAVTVTEEEPEELTLEQVLAAFDQHYAPFNNVIACRYVFFTTFQGAHQPFGDFLTDLKTKARMCEFNDQNASLICTQIVCGVRKEEVRKQLLAKSNLTLEDAISRCLADEASSQHLTTLAKQADKTTPTTAALDELRHHKRRSAPTTRFHGSQQQSSTGPRNRTYFNNEPTPSRQQNFSRQTRNEQLPNQQQRRYQQSRPNPNRCQNCHTTHNRQDTCPAQNAHCYQCSRRGHWAACCRSRNLHEVRTQSPPGNYYSTEPQIPRTEEYGYPSYHQHAGDYGPPDWYNNDEREINTLYCSELTLHCHDMKTAPRNTDEWFETIFFANFPVTMKLDTGSQVNIIHTDIYDRFPIKPSLYKPRHTVKTYSGHSVDIIGVINVRCASFANSSEQVFYVTPHRTVPILGARASVDLGLITRHTKETRRKSKSISATSVTPTALRLNERDKPKEPRSTRRETSTGEIWIPPPMPAPEDIDRMTPREIIHMYRDVFDKVGKLPGKHIIRLKPNATPTICAPRQIPHALQNGVRKELDRLQSMGIITPVSEPTDWVHPMVVVLKPEKHNPEDNTTKTGTGGKGREPKIRICLDPRNLNAAIKKEPYPTPTAQEIFSRLHGAEIFTVFDAQTAFWQVELDEQSSFLCTFATPFGRFRFLRLALGICTSSSIFQRIMHQIYPPDQFPNTQISTDDFLIATSKRSHNRDMVTVLERARQNGLTFSREKMQLAREKIIYLGLAITPEGIEIAPSKVQAIQAIPPPEDRNALQRFLGMVNFLAKFLPHHSTEAAPLRARLKKHIEFTWDANAQTTFEQLKELISTAPVLTFFNPSRPSVISVDSSRIGVGAVLLQDQKPIEYASTSFTITQQNYAPIERELLGIVYGCERFHYYVTGTSFTVHTDHRPLVSIVQKPLHLLSPRLQRLVLKLTRYNLKVVYVPGSQLYVADTLSRAPRKEEDIDTEYLEGPCVVVHATTALPDEKAKIFKTETTRGQAGQTLSLYIKQGWPPSIDKLHTKIKPFWAIQDELHQRDGLIYRGERLYVPETMRKEILDKVHVAHQGTSACLARARQHVYWPQMTADITEYIKKCETCQLRQRANVPPPLHPHEIPQRPWEVVGSDIFHMGNKSIIIIVDYFSKFVEAEELRNTTAESVIRFMNPHFARHGAPQKLVSDNGPPYNSYTFQEFLTQWGVHHITSSPHHPKSNGMAERTIQTIKNMAIKAHEEGHDIQRVLMEYRATPIGDLPSPAEMLMGRRIRTHLTTSTRSLEPHFSTEQITNTLKERQATMIQNNRPSKMPDPVFLPIGIEVYHYMAPRKWGKGTVISPAPEPHSYNIRTENGNILRRTRQQLRLRQERSGGRQRDPRTIPDTEQRAAGNHPIELVNQQTQKGKLGNTIIGITRRQITSSKPAAHQRQSNILGFNQDQRDQQDKTARTPVVPNPFPRQIPPSPIPGTVPPLTSTQTTGKGPSRPQRNSKVPDRLTYYHNR